MVHIRGQDFTKKELDFFIENYNTKLFNCHETNLDEVYKRFPTYRKMFVLELNFDDAIRNHIEPNKLGGFCIDLSHFYSSKLRGTLEYKYVISRIHNTKFLANHLNGFSHVHKKDLHLLNNKHELDFILDVPKIIFGKYIALELENTIEKQLEFKDYVIKLLKKKNLDVR